MRGGAGGGVGVVSVYDVMNLLDLTLSEEVVRACRYLERQGQRMCVDFGYGNAIEKARTHWNAKRRQRRHES